MDGAFNYNPVGVLLGNLQVSQVPHWCLMGEAPPALSLHISFNEEDIEGRLLATQHVVPEIQAIGSCGWGAG